MKKEGNESVTNCNQLKIVSPKDGKMYKTDVTYMDYLPPADKIQEFPDETDNK